jgi:hypothetical protein
MPQIQRERRRPRPVFPSVVLSATARRIGPWGRRLDAPRFVLGEIDFRGGESGAATRTPPREEERWTR